jgi:glycosyltransferase involved in cell wall biosynthesis
MPGHRDDVMAVLDAADVLVHPSDIDALPTAVIEAMAAALPVVATSVGGVPELVADGETGVLVPAPASAPALAEAMAPLVSDAELRRRLGAAGRARYERSFTAESWARRTRALYDSVLERGRRE